ncbi:GNAT family N-acetyltransferase [Sphingobium sp. TKS]|uniref:GNAT family N-acetyltransferase n=1 Tax=Sphingobium sp. TKS TaxID=1315974 RepID=UPI000770370F|nr:GNAT family N-acetyltransferase [Sphingobium sp. TKS]AMK22993.1 GCN5-like N-acetyltransferase [Sphingobium sp. TKS]
MTGSAFECETRTGLRLSVRPAGPGDISILDELFHHVSQEDLRFRFLSGINEVKPEQLRAMTAIDHGNPESFIAFDAANGKAVATAMLALDAEGKRGEVAISVDADYKRRGIGWTLLSFVAEHARQRGVQVIESLESRANHEAIEVERDVGFTVEECPGDPTLVIVRRTLEIPASGG